MNAVISLREAGLTRKEVSTARLPFNYTSAVTAIKACADIDECKEWGNRADAVASYFKQYRDKTFFKEAKRIKLRALRRLGELLNKDYRGSKKMRRSHATGINHDIVDAASSIAFIPEAEFVDCIEADNIPSSRDLRILGEKARKSEASSVEVYPEVTRILAKRERIDAVNKAAHVAAARHEKTANSAANLRDERLSGLATALCSLRTVSDAYVKGSTTGFSRLEKSRASSYISKIHESLDEIETLLT